MEFRLIATEADMRALGAELALRLARGDLVLLEGELGAGKTTLVRGLLEGMGRRETVRSPTFNLVQTFPTEPPVMHADLYRVASHEGIGLEDYLESHVCLIEWPNHAGGLAKPESCWRVRIEFASEGRAVTIEPPTVK